MSFSSISVFRAVKWETRGRVRTPEAPWGVQNIISMKTPRDAAGSKGMGWRRKEFAMLFLQLKDGEYLTIGDDIVIQVFTKPTIRMSVKAPKDMTILRGEVLERNGEERPACLHGEWASKGKKPKGAVRGE